MSRDQILARLASHPGPSLPDQLPDFPVTDDVVAQFRAALEDVGGIFLQGSDSVPRLEALLKEAGGEKVLWESAELPATLGMSDVVSPGGGQWYISRHPRGSLAGPLRLEPVAASGEVAAATSVSIAGADWGIAATGSVVQSAIAGRGRALAVLAPVHVAVLPRRRLLANAAEFFATEAGSGSVSVIVTGPSRTADIEKTLIVGVHGPKVFGVVLV